MNAVIMSFDPNKKQSERYENQLGKLKITCARPVKERQKFVSELCIPRAVGRNKTECAW